MNDPEAELKAAFEPEPPVVRRVAARALESTASAAVALRARPTHRLAWATGVVVALLAAAVFTWQARRLEPPLTPQSPQLVSAGGAVIVRGALGPTRPRASATGTPSHTILILHGEMP